MVLLGALLAFSLCAVNQCKAFTLISDVSPGLPAFTIPHLDLDIIKVRQLLKAHGAQLLLSSSICSVHTAITHVVRRVGCPTLVEFM